MYNLFLAARLGGANGAYLVAPPAPPAGLEVIGAVRPAQVSIAEPKVSTAQAARTDLRETALRGVLADSRWMIYLSREAKSFTDRWALCWTR